VLTQPVEFGLREELADLGDDELCERLLDVVNRDNAPRTGRCCGGFA
jgi:hypothetical protein